MKATSRKWASLGTACAASLMLVACGGGDDGLDETSAACDLNYAGAQSGSYRVTVPNAVYTRDDSTTVEPATFNGQQMLRNQEMNLHRLANGDEAEVSQIYYLVNADGTWAVYGEARAQQKVNAAQPYYVSAAIYNPPMVVHAPGSMRAGEARDVQLKGTQRITENGATRDESFDFIQRETFHGMEEVTLPLGRVKACKLSYDAPSLGYSRVSWNKKGLWAIKREDFRNGQRTELLEATSYSGL